MSTSPCLGLLVIPNVVNLIFASWFLGSVLNYSDTDGNIDILPILKKIIQNHIPVWVFR
jgi:serine carboxypeptidase-like clade 2